MDLDRFHHHNPTTTSELFICFTSRLSSSSSSMKLSKSILSPSHARDPPLSLPTSLSRRLRTNGSIKGGQSPMFPPTGKKRGSGFENPEPSSPKVTCIGQVKMKTKKKVKQTRSLSKRRSDLSFRKLEQTPHHEMLNQIQRNSSVHFQPQDCASHRNQRWVHLPLTIYEALREFSCLFPCRSSCFSTNEKEKEEKCNGSREVNSSQRSCGDVFARWLVALQEGEAEKNRGVELVVANSMEEEKKTMEEMQMSMRSSRRHVFEDIEFKDESIEEEKARVSISVPPKNALLLMRCRSDPMKMADLTNRFWESPGHKQNDEDEEEEEDGNTEANEPVEEPVEEKVNGSESAEETEQEDEEESEIKPLEAEENAIEQVEKIQDNQEEEEEDSSSSNGSYSSSFTENSDGEFSETEEEKFKSAIKKEIEEILLLQNITENAKSDESMSEPVKIEVKKEDHELPLSVEFEEEPDYKETVKQQKESVLPDCLLLMMCEPKLSMEVSKETWVCSNDFILPQRKQAHQAEKKQESMKKSSIDSNKPTQLAQDSKNHQRLLQPPRSSCSFPAAGGVSVKSMATMIEQKLVNAVAYEPFVLTRCKSEPMRSAAAKLAPGIGF